MQELYYSPSNNTQSIWVAGLCGDNITDLSPFIDPYPPNLDTKAIWGPFSLAEAEEAVCNFWYWDDSQLNNDYLLWGGALDPDAEVIYEGSRHTGPNVYNQWVNFTMDFSDLTDHFGDPISLLGEDEVYVVFYFHSDGYTDGSWGAFIDNISMTWNDGMLDIKALAPEFVTYMNEDTVWVPQPMEGQEYGLRLFMEIEGSGETGPFDINCEIDGEVFYEDRVNYSITSDSIFYIYAPGTWSGDLGSHTVGWTLDINNEVVESNEDNNSVFQPFEVVIFDSLPQITITRPTENDEADDGFWIQWVDYDREADALIYLYYDTDDSGFNGTMLTTTPIHEDSEVDSFYWDTSNLPDDQYYYVYGLISDGVNGYVFDYSDYPLHIFHPARIDLTGLNTVEEFRLEQNYPNPFNGGTVINYYLPEAGTVDLSIFDVNGRLVENLVRENLSEGNHSVDWEPTGIGSGVYFSRITLVGNGSGERFTSSNKMLYIR